MEGPAYEGSRHDARVRRWLAVVPGVGLTLASTFAGSLGLSKHDQRVGFGVGVVLIVVSVAALVLTRNHGGSDVPDLEEMRRRLRDFALELHDIFRTTDSPEEALKIYRRRPRSPGSTVTYRRAGIALLNLARRRRIANRADEQQAEHAESVSDAINLFHEVADRRPRRWWQR